MKNVTIRQTVFEEYRNVMDGRTNTQTDRQTDGQTEFNIAHYFFHQVIRVKSLYIHITKFSTSPAECCYTTLRKSKIQTCYQIYTLNVTINMFN